MIDPTGKRNGRGAYLCRQRVCWLGAAKRRALDHALQTTISPEDRAALDAFAQTLPETLPPAEGEATDAPHPEDTWPAGSVPAATTTPAPTA